VVVEPESRKLLGVIGCGVFEEGSGMSTVAVERALQYNTDQPGTFWRSVLMLCYTTLWA
jgi:hypothetical protein